MCFCVCDFAGTDILKSGQNHRKPDKIEHEKWERNYGINDNFIWSIEAKEEKVKYISKAQHEENAY